MSLTSGLASRTDERVRRALGSGRLELALSVLLVIVTLASFAGEAPEALGIAAATVLLALGVASVRWPHFCGVAIGVTNAALLTVPEQASLAVYTCLVPLVALTARARWRWGLALAASNTLILVALTIVVAGRTQDADAGQVIGSVVFTGAVMLMAWITGFTLHAISLDHDRRTAVMVDHLRSSIALELHDTVAHTLSLMAIRADRLLQKGADPAELDDIARSCREAIADLRRLMVLLRRNDAAHATLDLVLEPLTTVLPVKEAQLRQAGFPVVTMIEGELAGLPRTVSDTLAKLVHEATSNILRHGDPGGPCTILVAVREETAELGVHNRVGERGSGSSSPFGVIGMRERVESIGGHFAAGERDGRWAVTASIPLDS